MKAVKHDNEIFIHVGNESGFFNSIIGHKDKPLDYFKRYFPLYRYYNQVCEIIPANSDDMYIRMVKGFALIKPSEHLITNNNEKALELYFSQNSDFLSIYDKDQISESFDSESSLIIENHSLLIKEADDLLFDINSHDVYVAVSTLFEWLNEVHFDIGVSFFTNFFTEQLVADKKLLNPDFFYLKADEIQIDKLIFELGKRAAFVLSEEQINHVQRKVNKEFRERFTPNNPLLNELYSSSPLFELLQDFISEHYHTNREENIKKDDAIAWLIEQATKRKINLSDKVSSAMFTICNTNNPPKRQKRG